MKFLIVGDPKDLSSVYVAFKADQRQVDIVQLDESQFGRGWQLVFDDRTPETDHLLIDGEPLHLRDIRGAYVRFHHAPDPETLGELDSGLAELYVSQRRSALHLLLQRLPCPVANPPMAGHANGSKPFQMQLLARAGLGAPRWIASNDPAAIREFDRNCPEGAIVKSCSGLRSEVRALDADFLERVGAGSPPVVIQERIPGHDVRIHTVGGRAFSTEISGSEGVDYRFSSEPAHYAATDAPSVIEERCHAFAKEQELLIAGFDFRVDPDGHWWCLECNPAPTFLPYEMATGQPIADTLLDRLGVPESLAS